MSNAHAARTDGNQQTIVAALRQVGCQVVSLHRVGGSCPDLLVLFQGRLVLLEVKNPDGFNRVSEGQLEFIAKWQGAAYIVRTIDDALRAIGLEIVNHV